MDLPRLLRDFKKVPNRERLIILGLLTFSFLAGFIGIVTLARFNNTPPISPQTVIKPTPIPANLALGSATTELKTGANFDVVIKLSSPDTEVGAADFVVYFDNKYLKPTKITTGNYFKNYPVQKIDRNFIKISAAAAYQNNKIILPKGDGVVATITFTALSPTAKSLIYFDPDKTIVASDGKNIVGQLLPLNLSIN